MSLESNTVETTFPFKYFVIYVSTTFPVSPYCLTLSVPGFKLAFSLYTVEYGITDNVLELKLYVYLSSCIPYIDIVVTPLFILATIFIGNFLVFLNLKSVYPYTTVASLPIGAYLASNWWLSLSTICISDINAELYNVVDIWQIPPPNPLTTSPPAYTPADLYPLAAVLGPNALLYENISPGIITTPFILFIDNLKFSVLFMLLGSYLVVYVANWSGNASVPIWDNVTFGLVIITGILYWSCSLFIIALAASKSKLTPSTSSKIWNGSFT